MMSCACSSVRSLWLKPTVTEMYPIFLSLLRNEAPCLLSGLTASVTCGAFFRDLTVSLTTLEFADDVSLPFGASMTTGLVPLACLGRWASSRFCALVEPVPGRVRSLLVFLPKWFASRTVAISTTIQAGSTIHRKRTQCRPME